MKDVKSHNCPIPERTKHFSFHSVFKYKQNSSQTLLLSHFDSMYFLVKSEIAEGKGLVAKKKKEKTKKKKKKRKKGNHILVHGILTIYGNT